MFGVIFFPKYVYRNSFRTWLRRKFSISYYPPLIIFHGNVYLRTCLFCLDCCQLLLYMFFHFSTVCISHKADLINIYHKESTLSIQRPQLLSILCLSSVFIFLIFMFIFFTNFFFVLFSNVADENQARRILSLSLSPFLFFPLLYLFMANGVFLYIHRDKYTLFFVIIIFFHLLSSFVCP